MQPNSLKLLEDIRTSAEFILRHTADRALGNYSADDVLRGAVERHLIVIGEALTALALEGAVDPLIRLAEHPQIMRFRHEVLYQYDTIDDAIVWGIIEGELPSLLATVTHMIDKEENPR